MEIIGGLRKFSNEEFSDLCYPPNIAWIFKLRIMGWVQHVICTREIRCAYKLLAGKHERKGPLDTLGCRWVDNIKIDFKK